MKENFDTKWFDLKKYDPVETFDAFDWYCQVSERLLIHEYVEENLRNIKKVGVANWEDFNRITKERIALIKDQPIFTYEKPKSWGSSAVRNTNLFDLLLASRITRCSSF
jgi:hypothetical protein